MRMSMFGRMIVRAGAAAMLCLAAAGPALAQSGAPTGACCVISAAGATTCSAQTERACERARGRYRGDGVACGANNACPPLPPHGACCSTSGHCEVATEARCVADGGTYQTDGSACSPNPCVQPERGACCITERNHAFCVVATSARCTGAGGTYQTNGSACSPNPCPQPVVGACCITEHNRAFCAVATSARCTGAGGAYQGNAVACTATLCPQPIIGACCIAATTTEGAHCIIGTAAACTTAAGTYGGNASTCRSANCPTSCACDWDHSGFLNERDVFAFFNDWLAGNGDFNGDGATDQADVDAFVACYRNAPTGCVRSGGR